MKKMPMPHPSSSKHPMNMPDMKKTDMIVKKGTKC